MNCDIARDDLELTLLSHRCASTHLVYAVLGLEPGALCMLGKCCIPALSWSFIHSLIHPSFIQQMAPVSFGTGGRKEEG